MSQRGQPLPLVPLDPLLKSQLPATKSRLLRDTDGKEDEQWWSWRLCKAKFDRGPVFHLIVCTAKFCVKGPNGQKHEGRTSFVAAINPAQKASLEGASVIRNTQGDAVLRLNDGRDAAFTDETDSTHKKEKIAASMKARLETTQLSLHFVDICPYKGREIVSVDPSWLTSELLLPLRNKGVPFFGGSQRVQILKVTATDRFRDLYYSEEVQQKYDAAENGETSEEEEETDEEEQEETDEEEQDEEEDQQQGTPSNQVNHTDESLSVAEEVI
jgi:hypothetical protein